MRHYALTSLVLMALCIVGCATPQPLYSWGDYEQALYAYYKNPADVNEYVESLEQIIVEAEQQNNVPPGIYAEYGYMLLILSRGDEAILNFEKEKILWPESAGLMEILMGNAAGGTAGSLPEASDAMPITTD